MSALGIIAIRNLRADTRVRPYKRIDNVNDAMEMVGHNDIISAFCIRIFIRYFLIPLTNHLPGVIQNHFTVYNFAKQWFPILHTDGYEIGTFVRIIIFWQTDTMTMMFL